MTACHIKRLVSLTLLCTLSHTNTVWQTVCCKCCSPGDILCPLAGYWGWAGRSDFSQIKEPSYLYYIKADRIQTYHLQVKGHTFYIFISHYFINFKFFPSRVLLAINYAQKTMFPYQSNDFLLRMYMFNL